MSKTTHNDGWVNLMPRLPNKFTVSKNDKKMFVDWLLHLKVFLSNNFKNFLLQNIQIPFFSVENFY